MNRRPFLAALGSMLVPTVAVAAPTRDEQRRKNRVELWHNYAAKTENLLARLTTTRETSLLDEPLTVTGSLLFLGPGTLVLRDDGLTGSTTIMTREGTLSFANGVKPPPPVPPGRMPAVDWLTDRMLRMFAAAEQADALTEGARINVPRGGYRLEVMPPKGSTIRRRVRSVAIELDPVAGAITTITIAEAQGDRVVLGLADHRQNLAEDDLEPTLAPVRAYLPSLRE